MNARKEKLRKKKDIKEKDKAVLVAVKKIIMSS